MSEPVEITRILVGRRDERALSVKLVLPPTATEEQMILVRDLVRSLVTREGLVSIQAVRDE